MHHIEVTLERLDDGIDLAVPVLIDDDQLKVFIGLVHKGLQEIGGDRLKEDQRWKYGIPSDGNANYAWLQHMIHHLAPHGYAGIVLANGSLSSNQSSEGEIRKSLIEADLVDCIVSLPGQLFYTTQIPASLWFLARTRKKNGFRDRQKEVLFIDCRKMGTMVSRVQRELTDEEIKNVIAKTYHAWRGEKDAGTCEDKAGFCKAVKIDEIEKNGWVRQRTGRSAPA